jgi:glycosyltransferase involved in cell wall biosynthesis
LWQADQWNFLPNMVHRQFLEAPLPAAPRRRAPFVFLSLSGLVPNKNVDGMLQAFQRVRQRDSGVLLRIGGEGPERPRLEAMARELGIAEHVSFLGKVERHSVPAVVAAADAYVLASHYETFGIALIEALAMGLPAVATRCGGPETILSERQGILVPTGDVDALAAGMLRLLEHQEDFDRARIRLECRARFSEEAVVDLLSRGYQKILHSNDQPRSY